MESTNFKAKNSYWWVMLIAGIISILLGFWVFRNPVASYVGLSLYFAIYFAAIGVFEIINALSSTRSQNWAWGLFIGILDLAIGMLLLGNLEWAEQVLPYAVGFMLMFRSIDYIGTSTTLKQLGYKNWGWVLFGGLFTLIFSFLIIFHPLFGALNIIIWTALSLIFGGFTAISLAILSK